MAKFDKAIATALRLISANGQTVTFNSVSDTADPLTPWKISGETVTSYSAKIVFLPVGTSGFETRIFGKSGELPAGSVLGLMGAQSFKPTLKDTVVRGGETLRIYSIVEINPNSQTVLWQMVMK